MSYKEVLRMIKGTKQKIVYKDEDCIEVENPCYGENIVFSFENQRLVKIYS